MKTFRWNSASQTATQIESNAIPVYDTKQDAEDDLSNLEVGQLVATADGNGDLQPVIEWLASTDPLPTGSAIKEHLYAQEYTTAGGDTKYHYYIGKVDASDQLNNELVALETGAGSSIFVGTQAEWDALSTAEKNEYSQANITDTNSVVHVPVDVIASGNMNPVTSNAVYDALPVESTSTSIKMTMTNNTDNITGTPVNTRLIKLGSNWGIVIGFPTVAVATSTGTINCKISVTGATVVETLSINGWQGGNSGSVLGYNAQYGDFYILNCIANNILVARITALVSW